MNRNPKYCQLIHELLAVGSTIAAAIMEPDKRLSCSRELRYYSRNLRHGVYRMKSPLMQQLFRTAITQTVDSLMPKGLALAQAVRGVAGCYTNLATCASGAQCRGGAKHHRLNCVQDSEVRNRLAPLVQALRMPSATLCAFARGTRIGRAFVCALWYHRAVHEAAPPVTRAAAT